MSNCDDVPELTDDSDDEVQTTTKPEPKISTRAAYVQKWTQASPEMKSKLKCFTFCPLLFGFDGNVPQRWITSLHDSGLLITKNREKEVTSLSKEEWYITDLVEIVFEFLEKKLKEERFLMKALDFIDRIEESSESINIHETIALFKEHEELSNIGKEIISMEKDFRKTETQLYFAVIYIFKNYHTHVLDFGQDNIITSEKVMKQFKIKKNVTEDKIRRLKEKGNKTFNENKFKKAVEFYTEAIKMDPLNHICYGNRAQAQLALTRYREALCDSKRCIIIDKTWAKGYYRYAEACFELGMLEKALEVNHRGRSQCSLDRDEVSLKQQRDRLKDEKEKLLNEKKKSNLKKREHPGLTSVSSEDSDSEDELNGVISDSDDGQSVLKVNRLKTKCKVRKRIVPDFKQAMLEGSEAMLKESYSVAVSHYQKAVETYNTTQLLRAQIESVDVVVLKYAYGIASVMTVLYKNIMAGIDSFNSIISDFKFIKFPVVYYGLGKAYVTLNRFSEAVKSIKEGLSASQSGQCVTYNWPGTDVIIAETEPSHLQTCLKALLDECTHSPPPDAFCRIHTTDDGERREIYFTDPDFKGFIRVQCYEMCVVEFHTNCWKEYKCGGKMSDKDMLDTSCPTPDCSSVIRKISIYRHISDEPKQLKSEKPPPKQKKKNMGTFKTQLSNEMKISRRAEKKQIRKQKKYEARLLRTELEQQEQQQQQQQHHQQQNVLTEKNQNNSGNQLFREATDQPNLDELDNTNMTVLKKEDELPSSKMKAKKTKKKKEKSKMYVPVEVNFTDKKETQLESEFTISDDDDESRQMVDVQCGPFAVPMSLVDQVSSLEPQYDEDFHLQKNEVAQNLFVYFEELLTEHGPQEFDSPILKRELEDFPDEARSVIEKCNGLRGFFQRSHRFGIMDNYVCVLKDCGKVRQLSKYKKHPLLPNPQFHPQTTGGLLPTPPNVLHAGYSGAYQTFGSSGLLGSRANVGSHANVGSSGILNSSTLLGSRGTLASSKINSSTETLGLADSENITESKKSSLESSHSSAIPPKKPLNPLSKAKTNMPKPLSSLIEISARDSVISDSVIKSVTTDSVSKNVTSDSIIKSLASQSIINSVTSEPVISIMNTEANMSDKRTNLNPSAEEFKPSGVNMDPASIDVGDVDNDSVDVDYDELVQFTLKGARPKTGSYNTLDDFSLPPSAVTKQSRKTKNKDKGEHNRKIDFNSIDDIDDIQLSESGEAVRRENGKTELSVDFTQTGSKTDSTCERWSEHDHWDDVDDVSDTSSMKEMGKFSEGDRVVGWAAQGASKTEISNSRSSSRSSNLSELNADTLFRTSSPAALPSSSASCSPTPLKSISSLASRELIHKRLSPDIVLQGFPNQFKTSPSSSSSSFSSEKKSISAACNISESGLATKTAYISPAVQNTSSVKQLPAFPNPPYPLSALSNSAEKLLHSDAVRKPTITEFTTNTSLNFTPQTSSEWTPGNSTYNLHDEEYSLSSLGQSDILTRWSAGFDSCVKKSSGFDYQSAAARGGLHTGLPNSEWARNKVTNEAETQTEVGVMSVETNTDLNLDMLIGHCKTLEVKQKYMEDEKSHLQVLCSQWMSEKISLQQKISQLEQQSLLQCEQIEQLSKDLKLQKENCEILLQQQQNDSYKTEEKQKQLDAETERAKNAEIEVLKLRLQLNLQEVSKIKQDVAFHQHNLNTFVSKCLNKNSEVPSHARQALAHCKQVIAKCDLKQTELKREYEERLVRLKLGTALKDLPPVNISPVMSASNKKQNMMFDQFSLQPNSLPTSPMTEDFPIPATQQMASSQLVTHSSTVSQPRPLKPLLAITRPMMKSRLPLTTAQAQACVKAQPSYPTAAAAADTVQTPAKNSFDQVITVLQSLFPSHSRSQFVSYIQDLRRKEGGSLSELTREEIIQRVTDAIMSDNGIETTNMSNGAVDTQLVRRPPGLTSSWVYSCSESQREMFQEEKDPCVICHEELAISDVTTLECNHRFHKSCLQMWFREQSTCPNCRVHALLPDDFPALK